MVAATLFGELLGSPGNPYRGNSYELASIRVVGIRKDMSKPGSEPRGTASDEFPTRRVVTVTCKHQTSSGSSHRLRCQGKRVGRVCSDWLLDFPTRRIAPGGDQTPPPGGDNGRVADRACRAARPRPWLPGSVRAESSALLVARNRRRQHGCLTQQGLDVRFGLPMHSPLTAKECIYPRYRFLAILATLCIYAYSTYLHTCAAF